MMPWQAGQKYICRPAESYYTAAAESYAATLLRGKSDFAEHQSADFLPRISAQKRTNPPFAPFFRCRENKPAERLNVNPRNFVKVGYGVRWRAVNVGIEFIFLHASISRLWLTEPCAQRVFSSSVGSGDDLRRSWQGALFFSLERISMRGSKIEYLWLATVIACLGGCSVMMEASRPTPTDLNQFKLGDSRHSIREQIGAPDDSVAGGDGTSCDNYHLYTRGYGALGKAGIALAEGSADLVSLGLMEIVLTPAELLTKNRKHPVAFCYASDKLVTVTNSVVVPKSPQPVAGHATPKSIAPSGVPEPLPKHTPPGPSFPGSTLPPTVIVTSPQ
jgi:hypothetical protein